MPPEITAPADERAGRRRLRALVLLLYVLILVPLSLILRWGAMETRQGSSFAYWPDGLEYVAGAQSIADTGRYYLQVGPHQLRPRYNPGFSMLLAPFLWMGMDARELWRLSAVFAGLHAVLIASAVLLLLLFLSPGGGRRASLVSAITGLLAGVAWTLAPISVDVGRVPMSDEVGAFLANCALFLFILGFADQRVRHPRLILLIAGLALGMASSIRSVEGYLLLPPLGLVALVGLRLHGWRPCLRRGAWACLGFLIPAGLTSLLLYRSGFDPWTWNAYEYWVPDIYGDMSRVFSLETAFRGDPQWKLLSTRTGETLGNVWVPIHVFLGIQETEYYGFGDAWSWLGLPAILFLSYRLVNRMSGLRWEAVGLSLAITGWILGHVVLFSAYFFHSERFLIAAAAAWVLVIVTAIGLCLLSRWRIVQVVTAMALLLFFYGEKQGVDRIWNEPIQGTAPEVEEVERHLDSWLATPDEIRRQFPTPFDTVVAQALGRLPERVASKIHAWGLLREDSSHVQFAQHWGRIPRQFQDYDYRTKTPPLASLFPAGARRRGRQRLWLDETREAFHFQLETAQGEETVHYRIPNRDRVGMQAWPIQIVTEGRPRIAGLFSARIGDRELDLEVRGHRIIEDSLQLRVWLRDGKKKALYLTFVLQMRGAALEVRLVNMTDFRVTESIQLRIRPEAGSDWGPTWTCIWDWFSCQACGFVQEKDAKGPMRMHPVLTQGQQLEQGSLATFYLIRSKDPADLRPITNQQPSAFLPLLFHHPLVMRSSDAETEALRAALQEMGLPFPLSLGADGDIALMETRPGLDTKGQSIGPLLVSAAKMRAERTGSRPTAFWSRPGDPPEIRRSIAAVTDLELLDRDTSPSVRSWDLMPQARVLTTSEDPLGQARRLRHGVLPVFSLAGRTTAESKRMLLEYVYLELPLQRAMRESHMVDESFIGSPDLIRRGYANGLVLWLNLSDHPWMVQAKDKSFRLGTGGYLALGPGDFVAAATEETTGGRVRTLEGREGIRARIGADIDIQDDAHGLGFRSDRGRIVLERIPDPKVEHRLRVLSLDPAIGGIPTLGLAHPRQALTLERVDDRGSKVPEWAPVTWESLDPAIATVNPLGIVRIKGEGHTRIRASMASPSLALEMDLTCRLKPEPTQIEKHLVPDGLLVTFECDRPCLDAGILIQTKGHKPHSVLASRDPSWTSFSCWIPIARLYPTSTLTVLLRDRFSLQGSSAPFRARD